MQAQASATAAVEQESQRRRLASVTFELITSTLAVIMALGLIAIGLWFAITHLSAGSDQGFWGIFILTAVILSFAAVAYAIFFGLLQRPIARQAKQYRLSIEAKSLRLTSQAQTQYERRMDAIAAEHARTLAEIEARYAGG
ncbi:MAG TPA: hypothetical protein VFW17_06645 [Ktedonobacterales bacterium]|nr:hypothetical protein [Ktedonobacterales bacterium]